MIKQYYPENISLTYIIDKPWSVPRLDYFNCSDSTSTIQGEPLTPTWNTIWVDPFTNTHSAPDGHVHKDRQADGILKVSDHVRERLINNEHFVDFHLLTLKAVLCLYSRKGADSGSWQAHAPQTAQQYLFCCCPGGRSAEALQPTIQCVTLKSYLDDMSFNLNYCTLLVRLIVSSVVYLSYLGANKGRRWGSWAPPLLEEWCGWWDTAAACLCHTDACAPHSSECQKESTAPYTLGSSPKEHLR